MALNDIDSAVESFSKASVLEPNDGEQQDSIFYFYSFSFLFFTHLFAALAVLFMKCSMIIYIAPHLVVNRELSLLQSLKNLLILLILNS